MRFILSIVALVAVTAGSMVMNGCRTNPATGRKQLMLVASEDVTELGVQAKPELVREYGGEVPQRELREYVVEVGERLAEHVESEFADIEWSFTTLDSDVINAFALPGGNVFISRGLLQRLENEAQLAGVLGHEIGHVTGQHVDERLSQAVFAEIGLGVLGTLTESQLTMLGAQLFASGYQLRFGRNQEIEADELGMRYMVDAGYDPRGMLQVMEILQEASGGGARSLEFLSTHPHPETRIETINRLLSRDYAHAAGGQGYRFYTERFQQRTRPYLGTRQSGAAPAEQLVSGWCCCGGK